MSTSRSGRGQAAVRGLRLRGSFRHVPILHRRIIRHAKAVNAFTNRLRTPTSDSFPGSKHRAARLFVAQPLGIMPDSFFRKPQWKTDRSAFPDPGANPYLAYAAMLMAGLDASRTRFILVIDGQGSLCAAAGRAQRRADSVRFSPPGARMRRCRPRLPQEGGVFSDDFIDSYIELKMGEVHAFEHTPPDRIQNVLQRVRGSSNAEDAQRTQTKWRASRAISFCVHRASFASSTLKRRKVRARRLLSNVTLTNRMRS